jgi:D-alanyl-lipoteichoic acid acyltransferase DltB (MBOAT superfamily)
MNATATEGMWDTLRFKRYILYKTNTFSQPQTRHDSLRRKSSKKTWRKSYDDTCVENIKKECVSELAVVQPMLVLRFLMIAFLTVIIIDYLLIFRLDSTKTSTGKRPFIRLSRLVCANRYG